MPPLPPPRPGYRLREVYINNLPVSVVSNDQLREFLRIDRNVLITSLPSDGSDAEGLRRVLIAFPTLEQAGYVVSTTNFRKLNGHTLHMEVNRDWDRRVGGIVRLSQKTWVPLEDVYHLFNRSAPVITVFLDKYTQQRARYTILFNTDEEARKAVQDHGNYDKQAIFPESETVKITHQEYPGRYLFPPSLPQQAIPIAVPSSGRSISRDVRDTGSDPRPLGSTSVRQTSFTPSYAGASGVSILPTVRPAPSIASPGNISAPSMPFSRMHTSFNTSITDSKSGMSGSYSGRDVHEGRHRPPHILSPYHPFPQQRAPVFECNPSTKVLGPVMDIDSLPYFKRKGTELFCAGSALPRRGRGFSDRRQWCKGAFLSYESLHNLSSASSEGDVAVSSLAWGSQLDISTITLNYGSVYRKRLETHVDAPMSLVSSLSVTMDRYGDRDSASELLATHQNGELPPCSSALNEMANVKHPGHILQMKCLESGHLATLTTQGIHIWDSELQQNISLPLTTLRERSRRFTQMETKRSYLYTSTYDAILCKWDMTNAVTAANYEMTDDDRVRVRVNIPRWDTCRISAHPFRDQLLVGSPGCSRVAFWDTRSTVETLITSSAMTVSSSRGTYRRDPVFDCEWNPQDEHTFMTAHAQMIRIWDARMLSKSADQVELNYGLHNLLYRARWSPHHRHLIAGLCTDGQLRIWCTDTTSKSSSRKTGDKHELLFIHGGHQLAVSDFAWCPYMEDTIASVAPSTELQNGEIQVWRPRNLLDDPDNMDP